MAVGLSCTASSASVCLDLALAAYHKKREAKGELDPFAKALQPYLYATVRHAYVGHAAPDQEKLFKVGAGVACVRTCACWFSPDLLRRAWYLL